MNKKDFKEKLSQLSQFVGEIPDKKALSLLSRVKKNEIYWINSSNEAVVITSESPIKYKKIDENASVSLGVTVYEMNKAIVEKMDILEFEDQEAAFDKMITWINKHKDNYFMLYGREIHYFTVFHKPNLWSVDRDTFTKTLYNIGDLVSYDEDNDSFTLWIRNKESTELFVLVPFDRAVVSL